MICKLSVAVFAVAIAATVSIPGGISDIDSNDEGFQNAMSFAVARHNNASNDLYLRQVAGVVESKSQVVAGVRYFITVNLAKTNCTKANFAELCTVHNDPVLAAPYQCKFTVWSKPWLNFIKVLDEECPVSTETS
ncbi:cystatin C (amyloid angiopathy and cerebral hemorrhage) [Synchiropus splendidus]|uniref:cystatin C (amyloid angiopathy and cerebral hemorrhage) n=1 Tax=Synchiropus splendidus TaxID=270530 RepID=UPI00237D6025|nr:cystatin C (amyloid angiopathy and cerebral hemorrhage) [Synchiropus splendidus]